jgi:hypothetical protein
MGKQEKDSAVGDRGTKTIFGRMEGMSDNLGFLFYIYGEWDPKFR